MVIVGRVGWSIINNEREQDEAAFFYCVLLNCVCLFLVTLKWHLSGCYLHFTYCSHCTCICPANWRTTRSLPVCARDSPVFLDPLGSMAALVNLDEMGETGGTLLPERRGRKGTGETKVLFFFLCINKGTQWELKSSFSFFINVRWGERESRHDD